MLADVIDNLRDAYESRCPSNPPIFLGPIRAGFAAGDLARSAAVGRYGFA